MGRNDITTLERFRRVAKLNRVQMSSIVTDEVTEEISYLRSCLNAQFYQNKEDWMLPYWALKSKRMKPSPSTDSTTYPNNQFRNWFIIGSPGKQFFGVSDSQGLTTTNANCGSLDVWLASDDKVLFPSLYGHDDPKMTLTSPEDQIYEWNEQVGSIIFNRLVYHAVDAEGNEFIYNEIMLQNVALEAEDFTFFVVQRPMSVLGVEPIESLEYDVDSQLLFVNDQLAIMTDEKPSSVIMTTADNPNLLKTIQDTTNRIDGNYSSARGHATCILRYDVTLRPAGMKRLFIISPLDIVAKDEIVPRPDFSTIARDTSVERWFKFAGKKIAGTYPDRELGMVLSQGKASLAIQAMSWISSEESLAPSEIARVLVVLVRTGCFDVVRQACARISDNLETMDLSNPTEYSPYFWAFDQVNQILKEIGRTPSKFLFMKTIFQELLTAIKTFITPDSPKSVVSEIPQEIESEDVETTTEAPDIEEAQHEIPAESVESDLEIENIDEPVQDPEIEDIGELVQDSELETSRNEPENLSSLTSHLWNLAALRASRNQIQLLGNQEQKITLEETIEEYEAYVFELFNDYSFESNNLSVNELQDLVNLIGSSALLRLNDIGGTTLKSLVEMVASSNIMKGLLKYPEPIAKSSSHHALRIAHYYIHENERDIAETILANTIKHISEFFFLPEWVNLRSGGGSSGDGCSIASAADLGLLVRDMMVIENQQNLILFKGTPEPWFTAEFPLIVSRIPLSNGSVHLELGASANQHQMEIRMNPLPEELLIHLPSHFPLHMVKIFGGSIINQSTEPVSSLKVIPLTDTIVLTFHK